MGRVELQIRPFLNSEMDHCESSSLNSYIQAENQLKTLLNILILQD
jgi:hypothetical protein